MTDGFSTLKHTPKIIFIRLELLNRLQAQTVSGHIAVVSDILSDVPNLN